MAMSEQRRKDLIATYGETVFEKLFDEEGGLRPQEPDLSVPRPGFATGGVIGGIDLSIDADKTAELCKKFMRGICEVPIGKPRGLGPDCEYEGMHGDGKSLKDCKAKFDNIYARDYEGHFIKENDMLQQDADAIRNNNRLKKFMMDAHTVGAVMLGKAVIDEINLPDDAEIIRTYASQDPQGIVFVVRSMEFDSVEPGVQVPLLPEFFGRLTWKG